LLKNKNRQAFLEKRFAKASPRGEGMFN